MKNLTKLNFITNNLSILYIENDQHLQDKVYGYLEPMFMALYQAYDGLDGLKQYIQHRPDIIITSLSLLKKNAFEMIVDIQKVNPKAIIIVLSEKNDTFELLQTLDMGIIKLLTKPINLEKLSKTLEKTLVENFNTQADESKDIILSAIQHNKQISCISNYQGLLLKNKANLLSWKDNCFNIKIAKTQLVAAIYEKHIIVEIDNHYVLADLAEIDKVNCVIKLKNPRSITYKHRNKENKRISVDKNFKTSISYNKIQKELLPIDVSYKYITLISSPPLDIKENDALELTIGFEINGPVSFINEKKFTKIFASGKIVRVDKNSIKQKIVVELDIKKAGQNVFKKYLQQREIDIINEFKQKMKM